MGKGIYGEVLMGKGDMGKGIRCREHMYKEEECVYDSVWSNAYGGVVSIWRRICMDEQCYMAEFKGGPTRVERVHSSLLCGHTIVVGAAWRDTRYGSDLVMELCVEWKTDIKN